MKYHYQAGVIEKDKKSHKKIWLGFFTSSALVAYGGFLFAVTALNGWPLTPYDKAATAVKTTSPGKLGDAIFIPALNVAQSLQSSFSVNGKPGEDSSMTIQASKLALGVTPEAIRAKSPFYNLSLLDSGDELFVDRDGVRYAYKITSKKDAKQGVVELTNGSVKRYAELIGTVSIENGELKVTQP
jgi:hypothetical protein